MHLVLGGNGQPFPPPEEHRRRDRDDRGDGRGIGRERNATRSPQTRRDGGGERQREDPNGKIRAHGVQRMTPHDGVAKLHDQPGTTATRRDPHGSKSRSSSAPAMRAPHSRRASS